MYSIHRLSKSILLNSKNNRFAKSSIQIRTLSNDSNKQITCDVAIVGGGIVGSATARELLIRHPKLKIVLIEKEKELALHQSSHNSGVLHRGIYYKPGSKRAQLCVKGLDLMYEYCKSNNIPHERCGKLIVAVKDEELPRLKQLYDRADQNGIKDLELISKQDISKYEPHVKGLAAIWSPNTGIADFKKVTIQMAKDIQSMGGEVLLNFEVSNVDKSNKNFVELSNENKSKIVRANSVIFCSGLQSDRMAKKTGGQTQPSVIPVRGEWFCIRENHRDLVKNLIYPVPDPRYPWLGIHFTRKITSGEIFIGPNAILAFSREGYNLFDLNLNDLKDVFMAPGFPKFLKSYVGTGVHEIYTSLIRKAYAKELQEYIPEIKAEHFEEDKRSGVRALAMSENGILVDDFVFQNDQDRILHVRNAPSPAATSSLAIAHEIVSLAEKSFKT